MIIAVERELGDLKQQLESRGYDCFYIGENRVADAILYNDSVNQPYFEVNKSSVMSISGSYASHSQGALLINAGNRSIDEIISILISRTYSPLL